MLITCLFSLSAILAPVLIAIYILQHFTLGREPTLMVPNWQDWVVQWWTICCLLRSTARVPVCARMRARVCVCVSAPIHVPKCSSVPMCVHVCTHESASAVCMRAHMNSIGEVGRREEISAFIPLFLKREIPDLLWLPPLPQPRPATLASCPLAGPCPEALQPSLLGISSRAGPGLLKGRHLSLRKRRSCPSAPRSPSCPGWLSLFLCQVILSRDRSISLLPSTGMGPPCLSVPCLGLARPGAGRLRTAASPAELFRLKVSWAWRGGPRLPHLPLASAPRAEDHSLDGRRLAQVCRAVELWELRPRLRGSRPCPQPGPT